MIEFQFEAIGTTWKIDISKELSSEEEALLLKRIMSRIGEFDLAYSRFREDSLVTKMSQEAGEYELPKDAGPMMSLYKKMYDVTDGKVTPLIGQVLVDAGYDAAYSLVEKPLTKPLLWDEVMEWDGKNLLMHKPGLLDFGAGGKGYLVDIIAQLLENNRINSYCVDAGGDMRYRGTEMLRVGLEHPGDASSVIGVATIRDESICGSAGNRRAWGDFHHIISPETLSSPKEILAVWVTAEMTMLADLLTTGLYFTSAETLLKHFEFEYLILRADSSVEKSENFNTELFI